jgi:hypothetical protein
MKEDVTMRRLIWIMPEERDEEFSLKMSERFWALAKSLGVSAFSVEVREQYESEETPHYHMKVEDGLSIDLPAEIGANATYTATAEGKTYDGRMKMRVRANGPAPINMILAATLFGYYDEYIREYYQEWETEYIDIVFPC